jgi:hypothetical protein
MERTQGENRKKGRKYAISFEVARKNAGKMRFFHTLWSESACEESADVVCYARGFSYAEEKQYGRSVELE